MFDKLRGKSPSRHDKKDSSDFSSNNSWPAPAPAYTASSSLAPGPTPFQTRFASLSLHMDDRVRFLRFPPDIIDQCRTTILSTWPKGIKEERPYGGSHELKLNGYPWRGTGKEAAEARRLMYSLLATLHSVGWILTLNTDISKTLADKDSLLFRHQTPAPAPCDWCSIAFSRTDRIRFIDAPVQLYQSLPGKLGDWIQAQEEYAPGVWEMKLQGYPWATGGTVVMRVRELLLTLMETLEGEGWSVYASIDQKASSGQGAETDTWHLCRPKGWVKGAPVYHH
ncbi:Nn.00g076600.m01.CDS01 [Neocucurbitaria sp. VM-36]